MRAYLCSALVMLASVAGVAQGETVPQAGRADARIKVVAYNADDVVKVVGHYGYSTTIIFASYEEITSIAAGDSVAWELAPVGNHLFVKPRENNAVTNLTVVTNRRTYEFSLDARDVKGLTRGNDSNMFFQVRFRYPDDEVAAAKALADAHRKEVDAARMQAVFDAPPVPKNWDYWACGASGIWPTEVYDDGRFTYMRFPFAQELPAVFMVNTDGTESLANGGMHGDQYVVQLTAKKFVLRKGASVACVQNRSYYPWGVPTPNGTTNPALERRTKDSASRIEDVPVAASNVTTATTNAAAGRVNPAAQPAPAAFTAPSLMQQPVLPLSPLRSQGGN